MSKPKYYKCLSCNLDRGIKISSIGTIEGLLIIVSRCRFCGVRHDVDEKKGLIIFKENKDEKAH